MNAMKSYKTPSGIELLYCGKPDLTMLDNLANGAGDVWHSGIDHGLANAFPELKYQTATFWWYINDFKGNKQSISWRMPFDAFVIRKSVWEQTHGLDLGYESNLMSGLDFGYRLLRYAGAVIINVSGLFQYITYSSTLQQNDIYRFYAKFFKVDHSLYMITRLKFPLMIAGLWKIVQWRIKTDRYRSEFIEPKRLQPLQGKPTVSYIIPTMMRQKMTKGLLDELSEQTYPPTQVVLVDATPQSDRQSHIYSGDYPFELIVKWQETKGSCRARNEALEKATGEFIIFGDDDIKIKSNFIENHLRFLQTHNADACNGLDIMADHPDQDLKDLDRKLKALDRSFFRAGVSQSFNNANSCVRRKWIQKIGPNDINYDGGYGEDSDYGLRLVKNGAIVLYNPLSINLHLKPVKGGYRFWGAESKKIGANRKKQPWEGDRPVKDIIPVPSPTISYFNEKHFSPEQREEYRKIYFFKKYTKNGLRGIWNALRNNRYYQKQFDESLQYARDLQKKGEIFQ